MTSYQRLSLPTDQERLISFLTNQAWPFHVNERLSRDQVLEMLKDGVFDGSNNRTFWILDECEKEIGFIRLFDLDDVDDGYPLFDLRISNSHRGRGLGGSAVRWLTRYLFETYPQLDRIVGTTRADNFAMRKIFRSNTYVKEGHDRKGWSAAHGERYDTVKYGILREDWNSGVATPVAWNDEP